jgi:hypothetical protein
LGVVGVGVAVVRDDVHFASPSRVVQRREGSHEVRRHRLGRARGADGVAFEDVELEHRIGGVALEVESVRWVGGEWRLAGREDLVERAVDLRPERGSPCGVQRLDGAVPVLEPRPEGVSGVVGVVVVDVCAVLVVDVPHDDGGMLGVSGGEGGDELADEAPEDG